MVDPATFQVTDTALNRIAPVTECDARVIHSQMTAQGKQVTDYYLLDEIIVKYKDQSSNHLMGTDMDMTQFLQFLGKRLTPRSSGGDLLHVDLSPLEIVAIAALLNPLRETPNAAVEDDIKKLPALQQANQSVLPKTAQKNTLNALGVRTLPRQKSSLLNSARTMTNEEAWKKAFQGLLAKGILKNGMVSLK